MFINTASMYLGILDWLIEWLTTFLTWLIQWAIDILVLVFAEMFYSIGAMLMRFADLVQLMFKRLAGLGEYWVMGENGQTSQKTGDILLDLITNKSVLQVFLALSLIAVVMVIAGSIIQIVRTEYTTEGSRNSKAGVMGQALKSLMMFFIVPLSCVFGVYISSFLLKAIDSATNVTGSSTISGQIFVAAASEANKAKMGDDGKQVNYEMGWTWAQGNAGLIEEITGIKISSIAGTDTEKAAKLSILIDKAYAQSGNGKDTGNLEDAKTTAKYLNTDIVNQCYNMRSMNFIVLWFGGGLAFYMLLMAAFGMIMRLFKATVLFIIVPPIVGLMPLDGGNAFKQWRTKFIGSVIGAYGTIVALNLLFLIIPILNNVYIFPNNTLYAPENNFVHLLFTLVAMFMLKDSAKLISDIIGAEDAMGAGEGMAKKVGGAVAKTAMVGAGAFSAVGGVAMKGVGGIANHVAAKQEATGEGKGKLAKSIANSANRAGDKAFKTTRKGKSVITGGLSKIASDFSGGVVGSTDGLAHAENKRSAKLAGRKERAEVDKDTGINSEGIGDFIRHGATNKINNGMDKELSRSDYDNDEDYESDLGTQNLGKGVRGWATGGKRSSDAYAATIGGRKKAKEEEAANQAQKATIQSTIAGNVVNLEANQANVAQRGADLGNFKNNIAEMEKVTDPMELMDMIRQLKGDEGTERLGDLAQKILSTLESNVNNRTAFEATIKKETGNYGDIDVEQSKNSRHLSDINNNINAYNTINANIDSGKDLDSALAGASKEIVNNLKREIKNKMESGDAFKEMQKTIESLKEETKNVAKEVKKIKK